MPTLGAVVEEDLAWWVTVVQMSEILSTGSSSSIDDAVTEVLELFEESFGALAGPDLNPDFAILCGSGVCRAELGALEHVDPVSDPTL